MKKLSIQEKAELFDIISEKFYNSNFGSSSKSQIDLMMFSLYLDKLIEKGEEYDDYTISKQLGILQSNVRMLKKKKQLIYPREYKWYDAFWEYNKSAFLDSTGKIVINIPDPNVHMELEHTIEQFGGYIDTQLNPKLLKIEPCHYINLIIKIYEYENKYDRKVSEKFEEQFINALNKKFNKNNDIESKITKKNFTKQIKEQGVQSVLSVLYDCIPSGTIKGVIKLIQNVLIDS
ncbi:MAG: hypothetical protein IJB70_08235 [Clostridia bacterium]|nr:hypothetical protein [Clostridia bacterium]